MALTFVTTDIIYSAGPLRIAIDWGWTELHCVFQQQGQNNQLLTHCPWKYAGLFSQNFDKKSSCEMLLDDIKLRTVVSGDA